MKDDFTLSERERLMLDMALSSKRKVCADCGKAFYVPLVTDWVYKIWNQNKMRYEYYCSYSHFRKHQDTTKHNAIQRQEAYLESAKKRKYKNAKKRRGTL